MAYAAEEERLLVAVCLREVGFSEGVPRPVEAWTAPRGGVVLAAPQAVERIADGAHHRVGLALQTGSR